LHWLASCALQQDGKRAHSDGKELAKSNLALPGAPSGMRDAHENVTTLLFHLLSASVAVLVAVAILAFSDVDRLQTDIMVRADVRVIT
jgi:hypothetical protein